MAWLTKALIQKATCPRCQWQWRDLQGHAGLGAFFSQRQCPRCRSQVVIVYHSARDDEGRPRLLMLGSIILRGQNEVELRRALRVLRQQVNHLTDDDIELLVYSALQLAGVPA